MNKSEFLKAVEDKQIAEQEAKKATNLVEKVTYIPLTSSLGTINTLSPLSYSL